METNNNELINKSIREELAKYHKIDNLRKYAQEFFEQLVKETIDGLNTNILPIRFYRSSNTMGNCQQNGSYESKGKQNVINIYNCDFRDMIELEEAVRHEIIHYLLDMADLKHGDKDGVFHALCKIYNAGSYLPMGEYENNIYNLFFKLLESKKDYISLPRIIMTTGSKKKELIDELLTIHYGIAEHAIVLKTDVGGNQM
ncbi:hypothetical protein [Desulfosporosinus sp. FKA]|uniref:hypothetical protein n=1 Tax=Desulfosporosinus sp. FKA TaxID=1969834 RepID=UPI000B4A23D3|nr:hypothetical protein [Desulfosporosinus sp. FKA]